MFRLRNEKRRSVLSRIPEEDRFLGNDDSIYASEATNVRFLLERLYELKLERDNLELRHKRIKCRYSEATYVHLKVSTALEVYSTFPLSFEDEDSGRERTIHEDGMSLNARLRVIFKRFDEKFEETCEKTWTKGGRGIELLNRMKKPFQEVLNAVESLVVNGRL
ncbi:hypothetical protein SCHPADRAFT_493352 [Schizopora paradoxa]|uniref:Uncharacterized protein n=1 Tax=Schizopora paradoxa TaxID=27342 RepID=A0A0H2RGL7_9AGAM|nr:hypothetical protein SCHPADRAFT_493352 [Schizopora paradoxa]